MHNLCYYEAMLQLRTSRKDVFDFVRNKISNSGCCIAKQVELKNGVDLYLSSRKFAMGLSRTLKKVFKGELKISRTLYKRDRQRSKNIYRVTICFKL